MSKITPCLWFDGDAEEAARFYASLFPDSSVESVMLAPGDTPSGPEGSVLVVQFTLVGQRFTGLNGGPQFAFTPAVSFVIDCEDQDEVDRYWEALSADEAAEQCGWVTDRFGVSWQIIPRALPELLADPDPAAARRVLEAMLEMKKIDVAGLERARAGADR